MTDVGFSGTRLGMTHEQRVALADLLTDIMVVEEQAFFHHGDCVGADFEAHHIAKAIGYRIVIHPPMNDKLRAFCEEAFVVRPTKHYTARNKDIVNESRVFVATPATPKEQMRGSGTWSTYRYAIQKKRNTALILPDGYVRKL